MKISKASESLEIQVRALCADSHVFLIESNAHYSEGNKLIANASKLASKNTKKIPKDTVRELFTNRTKVNVIASSFFSYMHANFEKFMMTLLQDSIKTNTIYKNAYTSKFKSTMKRDDYKHLIDYSDTPAKRLSKLNDICRSTHGILNLCRDLLKISKQINQDEYFEDMLVIYIESRETNNILKHRGKSYDDEYVNRVTKLSKQVSKDIDLELLFDHIKDSHNKKIKKEHLIGEEVFITPAVFLRTYTCLFYLASYFIYKFVNNKDDRMVNFINNIAHSLMYACKDIHSSSHGEINAVANSVCNLIFDDREIIHFNRILSQIKIIHSMEKSMRVTKMGHKESSEISNAARKLILHNINDLNFKDKKYNDYLKKILELYFDKKNKQFLELSFSCDYFTKENYEDWALFISYHNNKFFLKSFKTKFNTDFTPKLSYSLL